MAITFVGYATNTGTSSTIAVDINGTLTGGIGSSPQEGDLIIAFATSSYNTILTLSASGNNSGAFTTEVASFRGNDTWDANAAVFRQFAGSTPDTSISVSRGLPNAAYGGLAIVLVWRGVDATTPIDVTSVTATGTSASHPDCPSITPVTSGAKILALGAGTQGSTGSAFTVPSGMTSIVSSLGDGTTSDIGSFVASFDWTSGAYDPAAATGGTTSTSSSWAGITLALRPAPSGIEVALTGESATASQGTVAASISELLSGIGAAASQGAIAATLAAFLSGQSATSSQGTVTPNTASNINVSLTGEQSSFSAGTLGVTNSAGLTGSQSTGNLGNLTDAVSRALSGSSITSAQGNLGVTHSITLNGNLTTSQQGNVTPSGAVNVQLSGQESAFSTGTLSASVVKALTGTSGTYQQGTLGAFTSVLLNGAANTIAQGVLTSVITKSLLGQFGTFQQGTVTPETGVAIQLTGQQASIAQGSLAKLIAVALSGEVATYQQGTLTVFGQVIPQYPLEGITKTYPLQNTVKAYPLSGIDIDYPLD